MKKLLLRTAFLIAATTLILINVQLLFDTSENPFFNQSTLKAQLPEGDEDISQYTWDYMIQRPYEFLRGYRLKYVNCTEINWQIGLDVYVAGGYLVPAIGAIVGSSYSGNKWDCVRQLFNNDIFCHIKKMTPCTKSTDEVADSDSPSPELH
jgi:hypothetical protein